MLVLATIRPVHSNNPREFRTFNYDTEIPQERVAAGKEINDALARDCTVLTRRIKARLPIHVTVLQLRQRAMDETSDVI